MYLSSVEIKNFRCIKNLTTTFRDGLNVIVGRNNVGKTNLLTAIMHALGPSAVHGESLWISRDDFHLPSRNDEPCEPIAITLTFQGLTEVDRTTFFEIVDFNLDHLEKSEAHVHFQATWNGTRAQVDRWAGKSPREGAQVPAAVLEAIPVTFLPALRDAESALIPGRRSRLAKLLSDLARKGHPDSKSTIVDIFNDANNKLLEDDLVKAANTDLDKSTESMAGSDYSKSRVAAADVDFERILRTLSIQMADGPTADIHSNGLGYNNLLYIAVVLAHLNSVKTEDSPLLLVEEPEAHLHPQLTTLLGKHLESAGIQTLVTTHSPVLAAGVSPKMISVFHRTHQNGSLACPSLADVVMSGREEKALQRMLDVTRATMYFSKGIILVEGISEALLIPVFANNENKNLEHSHISVIPIAGVAFETFQKLFEPRALSIPVAIITDSDPEVISDKGGWENDMPKKEGECFQASDRTKKLLEVFSGSESVKVFCSTVTLEYDLAAAAKENGDVMVEAWKKCFDGNPQTFTSERLREAGEELDNRALCAWRGICRSTTIGSKAEFAQNLAYELSQKSVDFTTPKYILDAINFVESRLSSTTSEVSEQPKSDEYETARASDKNDAEKV